MQKFKNAKMQKYKKYKKSFNDVFLTKRKPEKANWTFLKCPKHKKAAGLLPKK